jgi:CubicO group peptidase (beta-lactamase class C family)
VFEVNLDGSLADVVADLATKELLAEPGTRHAYSRLGYITAGRVAEIVTGRPFPQLMNRMLLEPVGAFDATFIPSPEFERRIPVAYVRTDDGFEKRTGEPLGTVLNPGGRLVSTLDDVILIVLTRVPQTQTNRWRNRLVKTVFKTFEPPAANP